MAMLITNKIKSFSDGTYHDPTFLRSLFVAKESFRTSTASQILEIPIEYSFMYSGDFYGILDDYSIPIQYHYPILIINNLKAPQDFVYPKTQIILPDLKEIDLLKEVYTSRYRVY